VNQYWHPTEFVFCCVDLYIIGSTERLKFAVFFLVKGNVTHAIDRVSSFYSPKPRAKHIDFFFHPGNVLSTLLLCYYITYAHVKITFFSKFFLSGRLMRVITPLIQDGLFQHSRR